MKLGVIFDSLSEWAFRFLTVGMGLLAFAMSLLVLGGVFGLLPGELIPPCI